MLCEICLYLLIFSFYFFKLWISPFQAKEKSMLFQQKLSQTSKKSRCCSGTAKVPVTQILRDMAGTEAQDLLFQTMHENWNFIFQSQKHDQATGLFALPTLSLTPAWYFENVSSKNSWIQLFKKTSACAWLWAWKFFYKIQSERETDFDCWGAVARHQFTFIVVWQNLWDYC